MGDDFCSRALDALGLAGGALEKCTAMLPDQYWVVATGGAGYAGTVVLDGGAPDPKRGLAAGAAWLRRIEVYTRDVRQPAGLVEGLAWLDALPPGFSAASFGDPADPKGTTRFSASPFRLELRTSEKATAPPGAEGLDLGVPGGGGVAPQRRAILTGDTAYRFTWTIERRDGGGPWEGVSVLPCE